MTLSELRDHLDQQILDGADPDLPVALLTPDGFDDVGFVLCTDSAVEIHTDAPTARAAS